ncbi:MAG: fasciclin domain-containing protein [Hyphomonadaceae bacterium]|nr:fasciclin domain-containing protein [Hyphomonadaceae bacterium]
MLLKSSLTAIAALAFVTACSSPEKAAETEAATPPAAAATEASVTVGGAPMYPSKNIIENAVNSADHTTLVAAVTAAGLVETLSGSGPFTVFAPTNAAFGKLPAGTVDTLLLPANKDKLTGVLTYHVVSGRTSAADLIAAIDAGGGQAELTTVQGGKLVARKTATGVSITDANGGVSNVTIADVFQSNGVIHVVDTVVLPKA